MTSETTVTEFQNIIETMDSNEKAMLLYTMQVVDKLKSKAAIARRLAEFESWIASYRRAKVSA